MTLGFWCVEVPCYVHVHASKLKFFASSVLSPELRRLIRYGKRLVKFQSFSDNSELFVSDFSELFVDASNLHFVPVRVH